MLVLKLLNDGRCVIVGTLFLAFLVLLVPLMFFNIDVVGIFLWALVVGFFAKQKGYSFYKYFFLSFLVTPLISIILVLPLINKNKIRKKAVSEGKTLKDYMKELLYNKNPLPYANPNFAIELFDECDKLSSSPSALRDYLKENRKNGNLLKEYAELIFEHYFPEYIDDMWKSYLP